MKDALNSELADISNTAQRKVQEQQPVKPYEGVAGARETLAAILAALMPVKPAGAATLPGETGLLIQTDCCSWIAICSSHFAV